jgi:hypothetical protein
MEGWRGWRNSQFYLNIAYGGGKFVAVGYGGTMMYFLDDIAWTEVADSKFSADDGGTINGIAYGGGKFAAVGANGKSAYSQDGIAWTAGRKFGSITFVSVAYGSGKFVAVEMHGIAYTYAQE